MSDKQPNALRLANILSNDFDTYTDTWSAKEASEELRRLHSLNAELLQALRDIYEASNDVGAVACAAEAITKATGDSK